MKQLMIAAFGGLLLIASCKCNGDKNSGTDVIDTVATGAPVTGPIDNDTTAANTAGTSGNNMGDEKYRRMFNLKGYTESQVREYRRLHDELDWGGVPGYYPEGTTRPLTEQDTRYLTQWGHKVMLNEIYARHGMTFSDEDLKNHFGSFGWYRPSRSNVQAKLTTQEKENIAFLNSHPAQ